MSSKFSRGIFAENVFNIKVIGLKRIMQSADHWKAAYKKYGALGLDDSRNALADGLIQENLVKKK